MLATVHARQGTYLKGVVFNFKSDSSRENQWATPSSEPDKGLFVELPRAFVSLHNEEYTKHTATLVLKPTGIKSTLGLQMFTDTK